MTEVVETRIKVDKKQVSFSVGTVSKPAVPFAKDRLGLEFSIARIFHRVLNVYRLFNEQIFEENDYKILGNSLSKILFENEMSEQNRKALESLMRSFRNTHLDPQARCRIYLEFQPDAGSVAMLPWEYLRMKLDIQDKGEYFIYLAADEEAKFDLIRSFPVNENFKAPAPVKKIHVVLVTANNEGPFNIDEDRRLDSWCSELKSSNPGAIEFHQFEQPTDAFDDAANEYQFVSRLRQIIDSFDEPYILHYFGHSKIEANCGMISFVGDGEKAKWIDDRTFASFFESKNLRLPHVALLQACSSGQIASFAESGESEKEDEIRGVGVCLAMKGIPAVVAMQNDVTEEDSFAFIRKVYQSLIDGDDVAEAVTRGRTFLGCAYKSARKQHYSNNIFGTPVLFLSVSQPFSLRERKKQESEEETAKYKLCIRCNQVFTNYIGHVHESDGGRLVSISEEEALELSKKGDAAASTSSSAQLDPLQKNK